MTAFDEEAERLAAFHVEAEEPRALPPRAVSPQSLRVPPQSIEAEQAVLGGLMLVAEALDEVADILRPEMFYRRDHQLIYQAILDAKEKGRGFDAVVLGDWFRSKGLSEHVDGGAYLVDLASSTPSAANIVAYAQIVADKATLRDLIEVGSDIVNDGFNPDGRDSHVLISQAASRLSELGAGGAGAGGLVLVRSRLAQVFQNVTDRYYGKAKPALQMPWSSVRRLLPGLEKTDLMILAARPGMGKTAAMLELAEASASSGKPAAIFSMEMSDDQLTERMLCQHSGVDSGRMRAENGLEDEDWSAIAAAMATLKELPIAIDDQGAMNIAALCARARRMHAKVEGGLGLVVVDYIQLMLGTGKASNRNEELSEISRGLKLLAKELHCPVVALSQLNRSLESRTDKRPTLADLRESGALEQDADVIAFLYRDDYYTREKSTAPGMAEFIVGKHRNGATGTAYLRHDLSRFRFLDYDGPAPSYGKGTTTQSTDGFDDDEPSPRDRRRSSRGKDAAAR